MKRVLLSAALISGAITSTYAEDRKVGRNQNTQPTDIKGQPGYFLNANVGKDGYCAVKRPENNGQFSVDAAVYYFQPSIGGEDYVYNNTAADVLPFVLTGNMSSPDLDAGWGFSVGVGYTACPCYDSWNLHLGYTRLTSSTTNSVSANASAGESLSPLMGNALVVDNFATASATEVFIYADSAKLNSDFTYNAGDLTLARSCFVTPRVVLTPSAAVKLAFIDYDQNVKYTGGEAANLGGFFSDITFLGLGDETVKVVDNNSYWGVGPAVGIDANWYVWKDLSIVSSLGASLLYGQSKVEHKETYTALPDNKVDIRRNRDQYLPNMNMDLGLMYDTEFDGGYRFSASLVYSSQYFWRYNQSLRVQNILDRYNSVSDDLSIQSGKLELAVSF